MATFDLNFSPNHLNSSFDLNNIPEHSDGEGEDPVVRVLSSSESTIVIDLEVSSAEGSNSQILELDIDQLYEESQDHVTGDQGPNENGNTTGRKKKDYTNDQRWAVYNALLERSVNRKMGKTTIKEVSVLLSVHKRTVQRIWKLAKETPAGVLVDVSQRRKKKCGRKKIPIDIQRIIDVPLHQRTTLRTLAAALGISYTTLWRRVKEGFLRRHSNALKPYLKEENKVSRLRFCLSMLDPHSLNHEPKFVDMYNIVHIDEKWFYMTKKSEKYYLLPVENDPVRTCQSKNFIGKVMFLVAIARPRFDDEGNEIFSGKIGVFPFVTIQPAQRRSRNRDAGTMEIKPITSVKREDVRRCLLEGVIPKIREKWPREDVGKVIFIQQDNARTHVAPSDEAFREAASQNGFDIRLMSQPPNSPDLNILDLGFFSAIQALQHKVCPKNIEELIHAVNKSFEEYSSKKINHIFLSLQLCMQEIMRIGGDNDYKIPHMKKEALEREGSLPKQIICNPTIVANVINQLEA